MEKFKGALMVGVLRLFAKLPWGAVQRVGAGIGWLMWKVPNGSRNVVRINLAKCFPEMDPVAREQLVGQALRDIGKSFVESACAWIWPPQRSLELVKEVHGLEVLEQALASGKGVVGITSHLGNWEVLNHFYCNQCKPIIFYRPPKLKAVDDLLREQRVQMGNRVAPSTKEGILSVIKEVRRGGQVGIPAHPGADQQVRAEHVGGWQGGGGIPACAAAAGWFGLSGDSGSSARSDVQHRCDRVGGGDEQGGRALCARVPEPVHVEHEALQEAPGWRAALVLRFLGALCAPFAGKPAPTLTLPARAHAFGLDKLWLVQGPWACSAPWELACRRWAAKQPRQSQALLSFFRNTVISFSACLSPWACAATIPSSQALRAAAGSPCN